MSQCTHAGLSWQIRCEGRVSPAKFIYRVMPDTPTTEVAIASGASNDLYVILNSYNPDTQVATMKVIVRPFVAWIWIAGLVLIAPAWRHFGVSPKLSMEPIILHSSGDEVIPIEDSRELLRQSSLPDSCLRAVSSLHRSVTLQKKHGW